MFPYKVSACLVCVVRYHVCFILIRAKEVNCTTRCNNSCLEVHEPFPPTLNGFSPMQFVFVHCLHYKLPMPSTPFPLRCFLPRSIDASAVNDTTRASRPIRVGGRPSPYPICFRRDCSPSRRDCSSAQSASMGLLALPINGILTQTS